MHLNHFVHFTVEVKMLLTQNCTYSFIQLHMQTENLIPYFVHHVRYPLRVSFNCFIPGIIRIHLVLMSKQHLFQYFYVFSKIFLFIKKYNFWNPLVCWCWCKTQPYLCSRTFTFCICIPPAWWLLESNESTVQTRSYLRDASQAPAPPWVYWMLIGQRSAITVAVYYIRPGLALIAPSSMIDHNALNLPNLTTEQPFFQPRNQMPLTAGSEVI